MGQVIGRRGRWNGASVEVQRPSRGRHGEFSSAPASLCSAQQSRERKFVTAAPSCIITLQGRGFCVSYPVSVKLRAVFSFPNYTIYREPK